MLKRTDLGNRRTMVEGESPWFFLLSLYAFMDASILLFDGGVQFPSLFKKYFILI